MLRRLAQNVWIVHFQPGTVVARIQALIARGIDDLVPTLEKIAAERLLTVSAQLANRGEQEAWSLTELLEQQRSRIGKAAKILTRTSLLSIWCPRSAASGRPVAGIGKPTPLARPVIPVSTQAGRSQFSFIHQE
jgi:hypothetical protein